MAETPRSEEIGLHNLKPKPGSKRPRKRLGRGEGSGLGKTSGRGQKGLAKRSDPVKILARGEIKTKLDVHAHAFSAAAKEKIEAAGGSCHTLEP